MLVIAAKTGIQRLSLFADKKSEELDPGFRRNDEKKLIMP
jgi:hypothetical protein